MNERAGSIYSSPIFAAKDLLSVSLAQVFSGPQEVGATVYKLCYYVPESHLETTKQAIFDAGAGRIGNYDRCCWQVRGEGQFRPLPGSQPFLGQQGAIEQIDEYRVEMVCADDHIDEVVGALKQAHPYEEPAYSVVNLEEF